MNTPIKHTTAARAVLTAALLSLAAASAASLAQDVRLGPPSIANFKGGTDADKDGFYETYTFDILCPIFNDGTDSRDVFVKVIFTPMERTSVNGPFTLGRGLVFFGIPIIPYRLDLTLWATEETFGRHITNNTAVTARVEVWDAALASCLAGPLYASGGPIKADAIPTLHIASVHPQTPDTLDRGDTAKLTLLIHDDNRRPVEDAMLQGEDGLQQTPINAGPTGPEGVIEYETRVPDTATNGTYTLTFTPIKPGFTNTEPCTYSIPVLHRIDITGKVQIPTRTIPLLPGRKVPVAITLENRGTHDIQEDVQLALCLSAAETPSDADPTLFLAWQPVNLAVGEKLSLNQEVTLQAGPQPPLDVAGPRRLLLSIYSNDMQHTNIIASECFWMGEVLNVITHGFKPNLFQSKEDFLRTPYAIKAALEAIPEQGSLLEGRIRSYVSSWESSEGFWKAFFSLFAAKIAEAEALNLFASGQWEHAMPLVTFAERAKEVAYTFKPTSTMHAVQAAQTIFNDLRAHYLLEDPSLSCRFQIIHLIGHSRGAAVNARVARLLDEHKYIVDQYTALDGFSSDWRSDAGILLGDISIAAEAVARKRVNYTVTKDLLRWGVEEYNKHSGLLAIMEAKLQSMGLPFDLTLSPLAQEYLAKLHLRAPDRSGFINRPIPNSDHLNIQELFMGSDEVYDNFVGYHRANSVCEPHSWLPILSTFARAAFGSSVQTPAPGEIAADAIRDGSFEQVGSLLRHLEASQTNRTGVPFLDGWMQFMAAPTNILSALWTASGHVELVQEGTNTLVQLTLGAETSLGQLVDLKDGAKQLEFDLAVDQADPGARLQVRCGNDVVQELPLDGAKPFQHFAVRMDSHNGLNLVALVLAGEGSSSQATVWLDNIVMTYLAPEFVGIEYTASGQLTLYLKGASGVNYVIESSTDLLQWRDEAAVVPPTSAPVPVSIATGGEASRVFRMRQDRVKPLKQD